MAVFNPETATVKTRHAIAHAQAMTKELGHPELTSLHLLMAALQQDGGLVQPLLERTGVHGAAVTRAPSCPSMRWHRCGSRCSCPTSSVRKRCSP